MTPQELYEVHNIMMATAYRNLLGYGRADLAQQLQEFAKDENGAFILHELIQVVMDICTLDIESEPAKM